MNKADKILSIEPVAEHDSWITLDLVWGCSNNCGYCYLRANQLVGVTPIEKFELSVELKEKVMYMLQHSPVDIPISIGNTTDMMFNEKHRNVFYKTAEWISKIDPQRSIVVITKAKITEEIAKKVADATNGKGIMVLSQSFSKEYDAIIERGCISTPQETYQSFANIAKVEGVSGVHFWRPFLSKWNDLEDISYRLRKLKENGSCCSVVIGLKGNKRLFNLYSEELRECAQTELEEKESLVKDEWIKEDHMASLIDMAREMHYPIFRHTSCAMGFVQKRPDINGTSASNMQITHCEKVNCPKTQRMICYSDPLLQADVVTVKKILHKYTSNINISVGNDIVVHGEMNEFEYNHLVHILHRKPIIGKVNLQKVWQGNFVSCEVEYDKVR